MFEALKPSTSQLEKFSRSIHRSSHGNPSWWLSDSSQCSILLPWLHKSACPFSGMFLEKGFLKVQRLRKDSVIASHEGHGKATLWLARIRGAECGQNKAEKAVQGLLERERRQVRVQAQRAKRRRAMIDQYESRVLWPRRPASASGKGRKHLHP